MPRTRIIKDWTATRMIGGVALAMLLAGAPHAFGQHVKIVGIGASSCARYTEETARNPSLERDYVAWAQGFMSAALLLAPAGKDQDLDLTPDSFPLARQASILRSFCDRNPGRNFSDGVVVLYRTLRAAAGEH